MSIIQHFEADILLLCFKCNALCRKPFEQVIPVHRIVFIPQLKKVYVYTIGIGGVIVYCL